MRIGYTGRVFNRDISVAQSHYASGPVGLSRWLFLSFLSAFLIAMTKISDKRNLRKKDFSKIIFGSFKVQESSRFSFLLIFVN